jgi:hypothetical protein
MICACGQFEVCQAHSTSPTKDLMQITGGVKMTESLEIQMAQKALMEVETLAEKLGAAEGLLESGYAQFAEALLVVQENRYWQPGYDSWGDYMRYVTEKFKMGRAQLYHKVAVVRELKGIVDSAELTEMGISKASVLADSHRGTGTVPNAALTAAKDPAVSVKQLKQALAEALNLPGDEPGEWYDLNFAFYVTPEEKVTLQEAEKIVRGIDPVISNTLKDFQQKKEVALRWAMEILNTYPSETLATYKLPTEDESI